MPGVDRFEIRSSAVYFDAQQTSGFRVNLRMALALADGFGEVSGRRFIERQVNVLQVFAEQSIELPCLWRSVSIADPPEPIAAFGDIKLLPGAGDFVGRFAFFRGHFHQVSPGFKEEIPGPVAFRMPDPEAEVVLDPTAGKQVAELVAGRIAGEVIADADRLDARVLQDAAGQPPPEHDAGHGGI